MKKRVISYLLIMVLLIPYIACLKPVETKADLTVNQIQANKDKIWSYLKDKGFSDVGAAAVMGNIQKESGFNPYNLENAANKKSGVSDETFTSYVNSGKISREEFVYSSKYGVYTNKTYGYGLCQWTYYSRKYNFYDFWKKRGGKIESLDMQLDFMYSEIGSSLRTYLKNATDISAATLKFEAEFERSADNDQQKAQRVTYAKAIYEEYKGPIPTPDPVKGYNPEGTLDEVKGGAGTVYVRGWAFDKDDVTSALQIHVYVGGPAGSNAPGYAIIADKYRPDVDDVYHGFGKNHGFDSTIDVGDVTGTKTLYVYAINVGEGSHTLIATKDVYISSRDTKAPVISEVNVTDVSARGYTVTCKVTDDWSGVDRVQFPTWIGTNPYENDGSWMTSSFCAGSKSGNIVTYRVNTSDYNNKTGTYTTHIYAWDKKGNKTDNYVLNVLVPDTHSNSIYVSTNGRKYTGKALKPYIKVKDENGNVIPSNYYSTEYSNNVNVGTATVKVIFNGKYYSGTLSQTFKIEKANNLIYGTGTYKKTASAKAQSFKLDCKARSGKITYKSNNKNVTVNSAGKVTIAKNFSGKAVITLTAGNSNYTSATKKVTITVKPQKAVINSVKNKAAKKDKKGKLNITWKKISYATGYEVECATTKSFKSGCKSANVKGATKVSSVISGLAKGKTYYVRVRAYKSISGEKLYGAWSAVKTIKVK